jgi:hypothetical protein
MRNLSKCRVDGPQRFEHGRHIVFDSHGERMKLGEIRIACHHGRAGEPNSKDGRIALIGDGADQDTAQPEESGFGQCLHDVTGPSFRPR